MCIAFFESHPENKRKHYALHYHCAHEGCDGLFESHHRFLLESTYKDCSHCLQQAGVDVDPDINPVTYYPPIDDSGIEFVLSKSWERVGKKAGEDAANKGSAMEKNDGRNDKHKDNKNSDHKSLAGVDSIMYHWRKGGVGALLEPRDHTQHSSPVLKPLTEMNPEDISHPSPTLRGRHNQQQDTHQGFAGQIPSVQPSPNTAMHRDLVNEQLARLPHHIAYAQQQLQPMYQYPRKDYIALQRKPYHWGGPQCYAKRTPPDLWQWFRPELDRRF